MGLTKIAVLPKHKLQTTILSARGRETHSPGEMAGKRAWGRWGALPLQKDACMAMLNLKEFDCSGGISGIIRVVVVDDL